MLPNRKLLFLCPDDKIHLWSQQLHFCKVFQAFQKMDKKNVQNQKPKILFGSKIHEILINKK